MLTKHQVSRGGIVRSKPCSGKRRKRLMSDEDWQAHIQPAIDGMRKANYRRVVQAIVTDVKAIAVNGQVSDREAVKLAIKWRRIGYMRGYGAQCAARRHEADKRAS